jgi:hypothetical protein
MRCVIIVMTIFSWLAISNHCTFATLAPKTSSVEATCPFHSKPDKQKQHNAQAQCCRILRAIVFAKTKSWAPDHTDFSYVHFFVQECAQIAYSPRMLPPLLLDTGPPDALSFAELILQQSLFTHAPPFLA